MKRFMFVEENYKFSYCPLHLMIVFQPKEKDKLWIKMKKFLNLLKKK